MLKRYREGHENAVKYNENHDHEVPLRLKIIILPKSDKPGPSILDQVLLLLIVVAQIVQIVNFLRHLIDLILGQDYLLPSVIIFTLFDLFVHHVAETGHDRLLFRKFI